MKNIWVPLSGQIAQQRKVETIANNIANANTVGFKKDRLAFKEQLTALTKGMEDIDIPNKEFSPEDFYHTQGSENALVKVDGSYTVFEQGSLQPTNNPLDMALFGKGFFEILTPQGVKYTRKGNFSISKEGEIVNDRGYKLLNKINPTAANKQDDPSLRVIKLLPNESISISKEGEIFSKSGIQGQISVVEFNDPHALRKQGSALFTNNDPLNVKREVGTTVNQGFVEGSNVNAVREMSELIQAHRHFENIQKAISTYDSISGKAANEISKF